MVILGTDYEGFESWPDQDQGAGPLFGIATALARAEADRVLVVAVDHAFVRSETLARLVGMKTDLSVVPVDKDGVRQVTCAVYPVSIADLAAEEAGAGGSIQSLLDRVSFQPVTPETWGGVGGRREKLVSPQTHLRPSRRVCRGSLRVDLVARDLVAHEGRVTPGFSGRTTSGQPDRWSPILLTTPLPSLKL